jgi:hypothetical protein
VSITNRYVAEAQERDWIEPADALEAVGSTV